MVRARDRVGRGRPPNIGALFTVTVGGQDDLVFDGDSQAFDAQGQRQARAPMFQPRLACE